MSEPIKVGDLVMVKAHCCRAELLGQVRSVDFLFTSVGACRNCGTDHRGAGSASLEGTPYTARLTWLKKIPPLEELEGKKTQEPHGVFQSTLALMKGTA